MSRRVVIALDTAGQGWSASTDGGPARLFDDVTADHVLSADQLRDVLAAMDRNDLAGGDAVRIGRYLFARLLDDADWARLCESRTELHIVITTEPGATELQRYPWELLHDGQQFLAARSDPGVTISRSIGSTEATPGRSRSSRWSSSSSAGRSIGPICSRPRSTWPSSTASAPEDSH